MKNVILVTTRLLIALLSATLLTPAFGQTWKKQNSITLPIVNENSACNTTDSNIALNADHKLLLTCQSGIWTASRQKGSAATAGLPSYFPNGIVCNDNGLTIVLKFSTVGNMCPTCVAYEAGGPRLSFNIADGSPAVSNLQASSDCFNKSIQQLNSSKKTF